MKTLILICILNLTVLGCVSTRDGESKGHFELVKKIQLGASKSEIISLMGPPNEIAKDGDNTQLIYTTPYKTHNLPRVIFWLNPEQKVVTKYINLFDEAPDDFNLENIERYLGKSNFVEEEDKNKFKRHYISADKKLVDYSRGIAVETNGQKRDQIRNIAWFTAQLSKSKLSSAGSE